MPVAKRYQCTSPHCGIKFVTQAGTRAHIARVHSVAGRISLTTARSTMTDIGIYDGELAGMDPEPGRWQTVCEQHSHIVAHQTLTQARDWASAPEMWCDGCMEGANR